MVVWLANLLGRWLGFTVVNVGYVALLGGALRILFERWNVGRVRLGAGGPLLRRREYFERVGMVRGKR